MAQAATISAAWASRTRAASMAAVVATNATLAGSSGASFSSSGSDLSGVSIAQAGAVVTVARGATVPDQNNVTGSSTTGGIVIVTFRDRP